MSIVSRRWECFGKRIAAIILLIAAFAATAAAATDPSIELAKVPVADSNVADLYRAFDLFGTFAADCGRPPSPSNPYVTVSEQSAGGVVEEHTIGAAFAANRYDVLSARRAGNSRLDVTVTFMPGTDVEVRQSLIIAVGNRTRRTIFNRIEGGAVMVHHGIALAIGKKTPVLTKCG